MVRMKKAWQAERLALGLKVMADGKTPKIAKDMSIPTKPVVPCLPVPEHVVDDAVEPKFRRFGCIMRRLNNGEGKFEHSPNYCKYGIEGGADYLGWLSVDEHDTGRHIEIELKKGKGGRLGKVQQDRFNDCWADGAIFIVVHGVPELKWYYEYGWEYLTKEVAAQNIKWR